MKAVLTDHSLCFLIGLNGISMIDTHRQTQSDRFSHLDVITSCLWILLLWFSVAQAAFSDIPPWSPNTHDVLRGDIDGDGHEDIVLRAKPPIVPVIMGGDLFIPVVLDEVAPSFVIYSNGQGGYQSVEPITAQSLNQHTLNDGRFLLHSGDFDGDGRLDYFLQATSPYQRSLYLTNEQQGQAADIAGEFNSIELNTQFVQMDVIRSSNGADRLRLSRNGAVLTLSTGSSGFSELDGSWSWYAAITPTQGSLVGGTVAEFRVNEMGAATFNVPITLPQGRTGVQPSISLNYSSSGSRLSSLGVGWNLSAMSTLHRCSKNWDQDNATGSLTFSRKDRLCLDGQRLIPNGRTSIKNLSDNTYWNASSYHTEIETFVTVEPVGNCHGAPCEFRVTNKAGETHFYGGSNYWGNGTQNGSRMIVNNGSGNRVSRWSIARVKDNMGNTIDYRYSQSTQGEVLLQQIGYTGFDNGSLVHAPYAYVNFHYGNMSDAESRVSYLAGTRTVISQYLSEIEITLDGSDNLYRSYQLFYDDVTAPFFQRRLEQIQECNAISECYRPIRFDWDQPGNRIFSTNPNSTYSASGLGNDFTRRIFDMTGDGVPDLVYYRSGRWRIRENFTGAEQNLTTGEHDTQHPEKAQVIDYNGDGISDLMYMENGRWHIARYAFSTTNSSFSNCYYITVMGGSKHLVCDPVSYSVNAVSQDTGIPAGRDDVETIADYNGDGLMDFAIIRNNKNPIRFYVNEGSGLSSQERTVDVIPHDFDNGGVPTPGGFATYYNKRIYTMDQSKTHILDANGDGISDILVFYKSDLEEYTQSCNVGAPGCREPSYTVDEEYYTTDLLFGTGNGFVKSGSLQGNHDEIYAADFNGDGLSDLAHFNGGQLKINLLTGTQFTALDVADQNVEGNFAKQTITSISVPSNLKKYLSFSDVNLDGRADLLIPFTTTHQGDITGYDLGGNPTYGPSSIEIKLASVFVVNSKRSTKFSSGFCQKF